MTPRIGNRLLTPLFAGLLSAGALAQQAPPAPAPTPAPGPAQAPAAAPGEFATADGLLNALERADENLVSLTAEIQYDRTFELQGDRQLRTGKLYFVSGKSIAAPAGGQPPAEPPARKFAVSFKDLLVGTTYREEPKIYIFDGQWLVEKYPKENPPLFIKRQVVPPGEKFDPLRIGEGPFPLPIGQKTGEIEARFSVELLPAAAGLEADANADAADKAVSDNLKAFVAGSTQIKLTPKPQFAPDENFTEIHLWYKRDKAGNLLPRMARTIDKSNNVSIVQLINVAVQRTGEAANQAASVPTEMLDTQQPVSGWDVQVIPWQKPAAQPASGSRESGAGGWGAGGGRGSGGRQTHEGSDAGDP
jgi:hypothetical protein